MAALSTSEDQRGQGTKTLLEICQCAIRSYMGLLGDIGYVPIGLLEPILVSCTPEQLMKVEKATREGVSGRDIVKETWPLWFIHVSAKLKTMKHGREIIKDMKTSDRVNPDSPLRHLVKPSVKAVDYKLLFQKVMEKQRDRFRTGAAKMKGMWHAIESNKKTKTVEVCKHIGTCM